MRSCSEQDVTYKEGGSVRGLPAVTHFVFTKDKFKLIIESTINDDVFMMMSTSSMYSEPKK